MRELDLIGGWRRGFDARFAVLLAVLAILLLMPGSASEAQTAEVVDEDPSGAPYVAGELVVTYEPEVSDRASAEVPPEAGASVEEELPALGAELLSFPEIKNERARQAREEALERRKEALERTPRVEAVDYNYIFETAWAPNDPDFDEQWGLHKIQAPAAWDEARGSGAVIAVVDTGVDYNHPDLSGRVIKGGDFVNNDNDPMDDEGHGTHVAGIASATTDNGAGIAGAAPDARVLAVKVLGSDGTGTLDQVAAGIDHARNRGAEIINLSLGCEGCTPDILEKAVDDAAEAGIFVVAAAGNGNTSTKHYPAAYPSVMAVGATNQNDEKASFSNHGGWVDMTAPGVEVRSTVPGRGYASWSGTSMAAPHVAGVGALLAGEGLDRDGIRDRILAGVEDLGTAGKNASFGWGRLNAAASLGASASTRLALSPSRPVNFNRRAVLSGSLATPYGSVADKPVTVWRRAGGGWVREGEATYNAASKRYRFVTPPLRANTIFQMRFAGEATYDASNSPGRVSRARAHLSRPAAPIRVNRGRAFLVRGFVRPRVSGHTGLYFYHYRARHWRFHRAVAARNVRHNASVAKYARRYQLPQRGRWYVRARYVDPGHAVSWSPPRVIRVR